MPQQRATCREQSSSGVHYLWLTRRAASWTKKRLATGKEVRGDAGGARSKTVKPRSADNIKSFPLARYIDDDVLCVLKGCADEGLRQGASP